MTARAPAHSLAEHFAPALPRAGTEAASLFTTVRGSALALSVFAHVAVVALGVHHGRAAAPAANARTALVEVQAPELEPAPPEAEPVTVQPEPEAARAVASVHERVSQAVAERPATPPAAATTTVSANADVTPPAAPSPAPLATTAANATPRFVIPAAALLATSSVNAAPSQGSNSGGAGSVAAPVPEREVDVAARLLAGMPPAYTASAAAAGVEASVPVELVIDVAGGVKSAVVLGHVGYGLDEAALSAVRKYRFSPARRDGKVVSVRMRWVVRFELG